MAQKLDPHYSDFGGIDTRSNKMKQNPKTFRDGSKNWRYTLDDELAKRYGFHHKTDLGGGCELGLLEYRYKDINTGQSLSEVLGVSEAGVLSRLKKHRLKISVTAASTVYFYSFIYDGSQFSFVVYGSSQNTLGTVNITTSTTLDSLKSSINSLSITGLSATTVDSDGNSVTSSEKAYHLDVVCMKKFDKSATDTEYNDLFYWETVPTPYTTDALFKYEIVTKDFGNSVDWNGFTSINKNNSLYVSSGLFVYKYDGASAYRAGVPDLSRFIPALPTGTTGGSLDTSKHYIYAYQLCATDYSGSEVKSKVAVPQYYFEKTPGSVTGSTAYNSTITGLQSTAFGPNRQFPVYSCAINGDQTVSYTSTTTLTVYSGHNIQAGMCLRVHGHININGDLPDTGDPSKVFHFYGLVSSVTATTVVVDLSGSEPPRWIMNPSDPDRTLDTSNDYMFFAGMTINGCYVPDTLKNKSVYANYSQSEMSYLPDPVYGAFMRIYRTAADGTTYYRLIDLPVPHDSAREYTFKDEITALSSIPYDSSECAELPRACSIIGSWQNQLVQGGRSIELSAILNTEYYPSFIKNSPVNYGGLYNFKYYQENDFCDYNSIYWALPTAPEGFPQSGEYEEEFINGFNDKVSGFLENKEALFVFKDRTTAYLTGTLATGDIVKEYLEADIGAVNHNCLQVVRGAVIFLDKYTGFWAVTAGRLPEHIGWPISNLFSDNEFASRDEFLRLNRAVSCNYRKDNQYICYIPAGKKEDGETSSIPNPTTYSKFFVFDYAEQGSGYRASWLVWQDVQSSGGILSTSDDKLYLAQKSSSDSRLWTQKRSGSVYDYSDHTTAIETNCKSAFINLGHPIVDKHWSKAWISSLQGNFSLRIDQYLNYIDTVLSQFSLTMLAQGSSKKDVKNYVNLNKNASSSISIGFYHNTINEDVRIAGWELNYSPEYDTGEATK